MFPLEAQTYPKNLGELVLALTASAKKVFLIPAGVEPVRAEGADWVMLDKLAINLDGATIRTDERPENPGALTDREPGFSARSLAVSGNPVRYQEASAIFSLAASEVIFDFARDARKKVQLVLAAARDGRIEATIAKRDIEALLLAGARPMAAAKGVSIEKIEVNLNATGPRSLAVEARVTAKKMFSAIVRVTGKLDIDDQMVAVVSGLRAVGEGMIGSMVVGFIQPKLDQVNGRQVPLLAVSLGDLRLRDVKLSTPNGLHLEATFGSGGIA